MPSLKGKAEIQNICVTSLSDWLVAEQDLKSRSPDSSLASCRLIGKSHPGAWRASHEQGHGVGEAPV